MERWRSLSPYWFLSALSGSLLALVAVIAVATSVRGSNVFEDELGNTTVGQAFLPVVIACAIVLAWALVVERRRGISREDNLAAANVELLRKDISLEKQAVTDSVTGLYNRRYLYERLGTELRRAQRYRRPVSLILLDLGQFKGADDQLAEPMLSRFARIINESLREPDTPCRYGGEEFAVVLPETGPGEALAVAEKLRQSLKAGSPASGSGGGALTISQGIASFPSADITNENDMIKKAEKALHEARTAGGDRIESAEAVASTAGASKLRSGPLM
jgi:diguanylate cyclase (GGDEF)-like protein